MDGVNQGHLVKALEVLFPANKTILNARKQTHLKYPNGSYIELDIWIPSIKLGFEFQDDYHYITTWYVQKSKEKIRSKDYVKRFILHQKGICLIDVPCWWDGTVESLAGTILFHRPDIFLYSLGSPITLFPPLGFFPASEIPGVGELMLASFPMDSKANILSVNPDAWWMGEKFDGIRCCWSPVEKLVYTRGGKNLVLLPSIPGYLPPIFVDAEFWFGRGQYTSTYSLFKGAIDNVYWQFLRMMTFDNASISIQNRPFEERYESLLEIIPKDHLFNLIVQRVLCMNNAHVTRAIEGVLDDGGEGVILQKIGSLYEHGRTPALVKLKTSFGDKEGIVVAIQENKSVRLKLPNGENFEVPAESVLVKVRIGEIVSFSYESYSRRELPVNPKIYRVRSDLTWEDIVYSSSKEKLFLNDPSKVADYTAKPLGHWTKKTMRSFMEKFAKHFKLDPLTPETWYRLQFHSIGKYKSGRVIMQKFRGYVNAVRALFPELKFDNYSFQHSSWQDVRNRRKFFEDFARANKFDPLKPENWYKQNRERIKTTKGAYAILVYHHFSVARALLDLFPNIGLDKTRFLSKTAWFEPKNRRAFFETHAHNAGFDPLTADAWYSQYSKLTSLKGIYSVIHHHGYSISKAIIALFPEVKFDRAKFQSKSWVTMGASTWNNAEDRRKFFEEYALAHKFDPLIPENWYSEPREKIMATTGAFRVMHHHNRSLAQALCDLFPDIGIEKTKFNYQVTWHLKERRRKFFEDYAKIKGFDPLVPSDWYSHPVEQLLREKGVSSIVHYHNRSLITSLLDLFPLIGFNRDLLKEWRFKKVERVWHGDETSRRKFFEDYAAAREFDPLNPENWYSQRREDIMSTKGASRLIAQHNNSLSQALMDLFPSIGLQRSKFSWTTSPWASKNVRRDFFVKYAEANGFDPTDPEQWYIQPKERIMATKGASRVIFYHSNSIVHAILDLFPDIGLDSSKLFTRSKAQDEATKQLEPTTFLPKKSTFGDQSIRRKFFEDYALDNGFDPLIPENWYLQSFDTFMGVAGAHRVVHYHKNRVSDALLDLFPEIGFDKMRLRANCVSYPPIFR